MLRSNIIRIGLQFKKLSEKLFIVSDVTRMGRTWRCLIYEVYSPCTADNTAIQTVQQQLTDRQTDKQREKRQ